MLALGGGKLGLAADIVRAESLEELVREIYAGSGRVFESTMVGFDVLDPETRRPSSTSAQGVSRYFLARYDQVARDADPVLNRAIRSGDIAYNLEMMTEAEWRALGVYEDVFSLHHMTALVYAPVVVDGRVIATLNLGRGEGAEFSEQELRDAAELARLIGSVMASLQQRDQLVHEAQLYRAALDLAEEPVVISDVRHATRYTNQAARRLLDRQVAGEASFDEELMALESGDRGCPTEGDGLILRTIPIDDGQAYVAFLNPGTRVEALPEWMQHSLTARERDVVLLAAKGLHDAEIAASLHLSIHTVKGYMREIFRKTGARSRVELARLASGGQLG